MCCQRVSYRPSMTDNNSHVIIIHIFLLKCKTPRDKNTIISESVISQILSKTSFRSETNRSMQFLTKLCLKIFSRQYISSMLCECYMPSRSQFLLFSAFKSHLIFKKDCPNHVPSPIP